MMNDDLDKSASNRTPLPPLEDAAGYNLMSRFDNFRVVKKDVDHPDWRVATEP